MFESIFPNKWKATKAFLRAYIRYNKTSQNKRYSDCARLLNQTTVQYRISNGVWAFGFQMSLERHLLCMIVRYTLIQLRIQLI